VPFQAVNWPAAWADLSWVGLFVSLMAGVVRGFSGFGFSALTVAGLSLFMAPAAVIPAVLILEIIASVSVWRSTVHDVDGRWLKPLIIGNAICIPLGVYLLANLDAVVMRMAVGTALLITALALRWRGDHPLQPTSNTQAATGALSGLLNGLAASGGVAAALMMAACHVSSVAQRGTLIIYLLFAASYTLLWASLFSIGAENNLNVFSTTTFYWIATLAPGMLIGMWWGRKAFVHSDPTRFRLLMLNLLILISGLSAARALFDLTAR
jgi:uncharacterized membrane protein YfcA